MTISVAIVGAGRMGRKHATDLSGIEGVRIVGVADVRQDAADSLGAQVGATAWTDYREMLDRVAPDAVYLCTPAAEHLEQLAFAAERGINVFVEKPLATSVSDALEAARLVDKHGILCSVGYQWRYSPATDIAREALADRPITLLAGWWYWTVPLVPWIRDRRYGGGQIFDQGTHLIDLMRYLVGDVRTTYAMYSTQAVPQDELPNWDASAVTLGFGSGAVGSLHSTYALFPDIPQECGVDVVARDLLVRVGLQGTTLFQPGKPPNRHEPSRPWNISEAFVPALRANDPTLLRATAAEGAASVIVTLATNYSALSGEVVDLAQFTANPPNAAELELSSPPPPPTDARDA